LIKTAFTGVEPNSTDIELHFNSGVSIMVQHEWQDETRQLAIAPRLPLWWTLATTIAGAINVETVVLPDRIEGTSDDVYGITVSNGFYPVMISQGLTINCFQCVRVWYRE
jgi:hypothetical protein